MADVATAYVQVVPTTKGIKDNLVNVLSNNGKESGKGFSDGFIKSTGKVGKSLTAAVTVPVLTMGTAAVTSASNFSASMAKVSTIADTTGGAGSASIDSLRSQIMQLSDDTGVSSSEIADAAYQAISAGQSTADSVNFVGDAVKLAKAGFTDTTTAVDTLTTAMNSYSSYGYTAAEVSDKLLTTQNLGKTTVDELGASLGQVIPTASAYGVNLDQLASAYVTTTKNGIATAESGTYINSMLNELGKSGTKASDALKNKTGKSFAELMDSGASLTDVLGYLQDAADESGVSIMDMFGSAEAGKAAATLTQHANDFTTAEKAMGDSAGLTQTAFETMESSVSNAFEKMKTSLQNTLITLGTTLLPSIIPIVQGLTDHIKGISQAWQSLDPQTQQAIIKFVGIAAVMGPVLLGFNKMVTAIMNIHSVFTTMNTAIKAGSTIFAGLSNPMGAFILVAAGVVAAGIAIYKNWDTIKAVAETVWNAVAGTITNVWNTIKGVVLPIVQSIASFISVAWQNISAVTLTVFNAISSVTVSVWNGIRSVVTQAAQTIGSGVSSAWNGIRSVTTIVWNAISSVTTTVWNAVRTAITTAANAVRGPVSSAWNTVRSVTAAVWNSVRSVITTAWNGIKSVSLSVANAVKSGVSSAWNGIRSVTSSVWNGIKSIVSGAINGIKSTVSSGLHGALSTVSSVLGSIKSKFSSIFDGCKSIVTGAISRIKGAFNFSWHLPKLELPHISVSGGVAPFGIAGKGSLPHFSIQWYANGGILKSPTIFGLNGDSLMGGGEAGPEAVLPIENLRSYIRDALEEDRASGDFNQTINIYSPQALTPSEIARQTRNQTRSMVLAMKGRR